MVRSLASLWKCSEALPWLSLPQQAAWTVAKERMCPGTARGRDILRQVMQGTRTRVRTVGLALDRRGGWWSHGVRIAFGGLWSVITTIESRELRTLRWSPGEGMWIQRWPEGRVADVRRWAEWREWATQGEPYDMENLLFRYYRPGNGDIVIDVGAGHGGETFALADMVGPSGRVLAIEAAPETYQRLAALCRLNNWKHVEPIQAAVAAEPGTVTISDGTPWVATNIFEPGQTEVPAVTVDDLCRDRGIRNIDWLKMNIEGAEREAINGMEGIAPGIRHVTIACHDFIGTDWSKSKDAVIAWLVDHGFNVRERDDAVEPWARDYVYGWR